ncbi:MAG: hypothetical protein QXQ40_00450 [Candidatus Aenigmatarchaeota archaeon]
MTIYGRCMSRQEARELKRTMELRDNGSGLVPVFDSPRYVEERLRKMSKDQLRNYFRRIGVRNPYEIVLFEISESIDEMVGPIPQTNGLIEYKIPEGTRVKVYSTIKL